jgi:DNA primase
MQVLTGVPASQEAIIAHYRRIAPLLESRFGAIPIVWTAYPFGPESPPQWHVHYFGHWTKLSAEHLERLAAIGAQEFYSWFPLPGTLDRARFMRLLLEPEPGQNPDRLREAVAAVREEIDASHAPLCMLDGLGNAELWLTVGGGPSYDDVRARAHAIATRVAAKHPDLISLVMLRYRSTAEVSRPTDRVHLHVSNNAVGRWTIVPYCYRPKTGRIATPIRWNELDSCDILGVPLADFEMRVQQHGDVLAEWLNAQSPQLMYGTKNNAKGAVIQAAITLLADGKARTAEQIVDEAVAQNLMKPTPATTAYVSLISYITRCKGRARHCDIVENPDKTFRLNEPPDAWPVVPVTPPAPLTKDQQDLIDRLHTSVLDGDDPDHFEIAVCDAFTALGFASKHIGGHGAPDGYADAQLGTLGYRVMIECKSGQAIHTAGIFEAAKYKDTYNAQYCMIIGQDVGEQVEIEEEIKTHGVSAWSVDDLATLITLRANPLEILPMLQPGVVASDVLQDIIWERNHGKAKRVRIVAEILRASAWATQCVAVDTGPPANAPVLTEDAAILLVDQELISRGSHVSCTRDELSLAINWLTSPLVGAAVWDTAKSGLVVLSS